MRLILSKYPRPFKEKHEGDSTIIYETGKRTTDYGDLQESFDEFVEETEGELGLGPTEVMLDIAPHHNVQPKTDGTYPTQYNYDKKVLSKFEEAVKKFKPTAIDVLKTASRLQDEKIKEQIIAMLFKDDTWLSELCDYVSSRSIVRAENVKQINSATKNITGKGFELDKEQKLAIEKFTELAHLQRGEPEEAMRRVVKFHSGVLSFALEHTGDLTHRMNEMLFLKPFGQGRNDVRRKSLNVLTLLNSSYGFEREHEKNVANNAKEMGISIREYKTKLDKLLLEYEKAHSKLPVYNELQWVARQAAIELGKQNFLAVKKLLKKLIDISSDEDRYVKMLGVYHENNGLISKIS